MGAALTEYAAYPGKPMRILALPEVRAQYLAARPNAVGSNPAAFGAYTETEREKWAKVVKAGGMGAG